MPARVWDVILLQDILGAAMETARPRRLAAAWLASAVMVGAWGWFLIQGVRDPLGGINSLWPLFGIANQLLASIALCLATTVILKMQLSPPALGARIYNPSRPSRLHSHARVPLAWLLAVTMTAGLEKIYQRRSTHLGFLAAAQNLKDRLHFNALLDAAVTGVFLLASFLIFALSVREWFLLLGRKKLANSTNPPRSGCRTTPIKEAGAANALGAVSLALLLVKELSGQSAMDRAEICQTHNHQHDRQKAYLQTVEKRFDGINRCC